MYTIHGDCNESSLNPRKLIFLINDFLFVELKGAYFPKPRWNFLAVLT